MTIPIIMRMGMAHPLALMSDDVDDNDKYDDIHVVINSLFLSL